MDLICQSKDMECLNVFKKQRETHYRSKVTHRLIAKGWKKIFHANGNKKKAGVAILISDKKDFQTKTVIKDKEGRDLQNGGRVRRGDHLPPHEYIRNTSTCGTTPKEHLLNTGRRPQTSQNIYIYFSFFSFCECVCVCFFV